MAFDVGGGVDVDFTEMERTLLLFLLSFWLFWLFWLFW